VRGSQQLLLASLVVASGATVAGCSGAPDAESERLGEAEQAATVCVTIQRGVGTSVVKDTYLYQTAPTNRPGTDPDFYAGVYSGSLQYGLLQFDLSAVPAGATITSADITLSLGSSTSDTVRFHKVTSPWTEATASWSTHGTAWNSTVEGSFTAGIYGSRTFSATALVQSWVSNPSTNNGMLFEQTANRTQMKTSEASADRRPKLVVCYDDGTGSSSSASSSSSSASSSSASSSSSSASSSSASSSSASSSSSSGAGGTGGTGGTGGAGGAGGGSGGGVPGLPISCAANTLGAGNNCGASQTDDCCATLPVAGGTFNRLNDASLPATVSSFYLDKYLVTVGRFRQYIEQTGGPTQANPPPSGTGAHPRIANSGWDPAWNSMLAANTTALKTALVCDAYGWADWSNTPTPRTINHYNPDGTVVSTETVDWEHKPIVCATWLELFGFCAWDGGRLPTQAEMNYASAGGNEQRYYPWGSASIDTTQAAWCCQADGTVTANCGPNHDSPTYRCSQISLMSAPSPPAPGGGGSSISPAPRTRRPATARTITTC
jgi:hypothetical protein